MMGNTLQIVCRSSSHSVTSVFGMTKLILKFFLQGLCGADLPERKLDACFLCQLTNLVFEARDTGHEGLWLKLMAIWFPLSQSLRAQISLAIKDILRCDNPSWLVLMLSGQNFLNAY